MKLTQYTILGFVLLITGGFVVAELSLNADIMDYKKEIKSGSVCIKTSDKIEITNITEPLTMYEIATIYSQSDKKSKVAECFTITKEVNTKGDKVQHRLIEIKKK